MQKLMLDKEAMIRYLGEVIDAEMAKPEEEIDLALVTECDLYLAELISDVEISPEQMAENMAKIKSMAGHTETTSVRIRKPIRVRRIIAAVCAAILLIAGSITACSFIPALRDMFRGVLNLEQGESIDDEGVTYLYRGVTETYKDMAELVEKEKLGILYPHELPSELKIKTISAFGEGSPSSYMISFTDEETTISIRAGEIDTSMLTHCEPFVNDKEITSYIDTQDDTFISTTVHNGWTYYITANNKDHLMTILENLY